jgi:hypothetical protein
MTPELPGTHCAYGGVMLQIGAGTPYYVCDGAPGAPGTNGTDGQSVAVEPELAGANCATGGQKLTVGSGTPTYVCNGADGADGDSVTVTSEPAGSNCANGGQAIQVGAGTPSYVCNGGTGIVSTVGIDGWRTNVTWVANAWAFYGPTATVTLTAGQRITGSIGAAMQLQAVVPYFFAGICYSNGGPTTLAGTAYYYQLPQSGQWQDATWSVTKVLPAGTYTVGFCTFSPVGGSFLQIGVDGFIQVTN